MSLRDKPPKNTSELKRKAANSKKSYWEQTLEKQDIILSRAYTTVKALICMVLSALRKILLN